MYRWSLRQPAKAGGRQSRFRLLLLVFFLLLSPLNLAAEEGTQAQTGKDALSASSTQTGTGACSKAKIDQTFGSYLLQVEQPAAEVERIQTRLNELGYAANIADDGIFGPDTSSAMQAFCRVQQLPPLATQTAYLLVRLLFGNSELKSVPVAGLQASSGPEVYYRLSAETEGNAGTNGSGSSSQSASASTTTDDDATTGEDNAGASTASESTNGADGQAVASPGVSPVEVAASPGPDCWIPAQLTGTGSASAGSTASGYDISPDSSTDQPGLPDTVTERLQGVAYPNQEMFDQAVCTFLENADVTTATFTGMDSVRNQARQTPGEQFAPIQLSGGECGCSRDLTSKVYGFYPYWLPQEDVEQTLDFSLFDRLSFYALTLTSEGKIENNLQWSDDGNMADLVGLTQKYRVALDLAVYAEEWQDWNESTMNKAVTTLVSALGKKFTSQNYTWLTWVASLTGGASTPQADGITLVFDNYGSDAQSSDKIVTFIGKLKKEFAGIEPVPSINILLDIAPEIFGNKMPYDTDLFAPLEEILLPQDETASAVDNLLIYLPEPTSFAKKLLRHTVENEFQGAERQAVLRMILPVISSYGHAADTRAPYAQFTDDLIYFQDNFAGVGLWPTPLATDADTPDIEAKLLEVYARDDGTNRIGELIDRLVPGLCQFVCPNRWLFRLGFDLLLGALLLYAVLSARFCRLCVFYRKYFFYFIAVGLATLLIMLLSLVCDPFWEERVDYVVGLTALLVILGFIGNSVYRKIQPPLP